MTSFVVPGRPIPKGRPRTVTTPTGRSRTFTPRRTRDFEELVAWHAKLARVRPLAGDVALTVRLYGTHADGDNVLKAVADGLQGVAYTNDSQITEWHAYVVRRDPQPRTEIQVEAVA